MFRTDYPHVRGLIEAELYRLSKDKEMQVANAILYTIRKGFAQPKHGRTYRLPGGQTYRASAPGEYPAIKFGHLADHGKTYAAALYDATYLGTTVPYGVDLEGMSFWSMMVFAKAGWDPRRVLAGEKGDVSGWDARGIRPWLRRGFWESEDEIAVIMRQKWVITV